MDISIIIVNYRSAPLIIDCLNSLSKHKTISYEIIVVDNDSKDNSQLILLSQYPAINWIQMEYNAGFARANNAGIKASKAQTILLLNPDTLEVDNSIEQIFKLFSASNYVACGTQLLNADQTPQISGNYAIKGGLNYLLPLPYMGATLKWVGEALGTKKPNVQEATEIVEVDWINGAFLMVKKEVIDKAGLLDEDFFLYSEEAEWCSRLKKYGKLCIYGNFHMIHLQGETSNATFKSEGKGYYNLYDRKGLQIMLSNFVRIRKEFGTQWFLLMLLLYTIEIPVIWLFPIIEGIFRLSNPFRHLKAAKGFTQNVLSLWLHASLIIRNRPHFYKVL